MATMNHTNLTTYDVPALTEFFCSSKSQLSFDSSLS
jgi:hypothetical protein